MIAWIKKNWKIVAGFIVVIGSFVFGLVLRGSSGRKQDVFGQGNGGDQKGLQGASGVLGNTQADQRIAAETNNGLGKSVDASKAIAESIASDIVRSKQTIDSAKQQLTKLGKDLGIE